MSNFNNPSNLPPGVTDRMIEEQQECQHPATLEITVGTRRVRQCEDCDTIVPEAADPFDDDRGDDPIEFTESDAGDRGRERWARSYDDLNGGPESDGDR